MAAASLVCNTITQVVEVRVHAGLVLAAIAAIDGAGCGSVVWRVVRGKGVHGSHGGDRGERSCVRAAVCLVLIVTVAMCTANQKGGAHHRSMLGRM